MSRHHTSLALLSAALLVAPLFAAPVPKSDGPDVDKLLARVVLENLSGTLAQPGVIKALNLTDEQKQKLNDLSVDMVAKAGKQLAVANGKQNGPGGDATEMLAVFAAIGEMNLAYDAEVPALLTADQIRRLRQIQLQREGPAALLGRHGLRALQPTAEQEDKMAAEFAKRRKMMMLDEIIAASAGGMAVAGGAADALKDVLKQVGDDTDAVQEAMLKVLTPEQRATWKKVVGELLPRAELILGGSPFGDGKLVIGIMEAQAVQAMPALPAAPPLVIPAGGAVPPNLPPPAALPPGPPLQLPPPPPAEKK